MNTTTTTTYGLHLTLRLAEVQNRYAMEGKEAIADLLVALVNRIGMRILAGPLVGEESGDTDHYGWSGVLILYESHCAIHTYPERGEAFLDIFSCRRFDIEAVTETLSRFLGDFSVVEQNQFQRGIHWGSDVEREMNLWRLTR